jgi:pimeloyl-ACP methyl ester carboxylesterase
MKASAISILLFVIFNCFSVQAQTIDTLIDVGGYKLHFDIIKGKGIPILFEAGGGEDATTWKKIIHPIAERTATTLITYDRAGFGKSTFDTARHGILNGMTGLETALKKLGYDQARRNATDDRPSKYRQSKGIASRLLLPGG